MDELQDRLARLGLDVLADFGFALAGGYALQAHGLVDRLSEDLDLFTNRWDAADFDRAVQALSQAYGREGFEVRLTRRAETFARLEVTEPQTNHTTTVDLAADFRQMRPVALSVGPVLAERDAVGSKVAAAFSRGEARDYLDLAGILDSGRFTRESLMELAAEVDPGFSTARFAESLAGIDRYDDTDFVVYGIDPERVEAVRRVMREWSRELEVEGPQHRHQTINPSGVSPKGVHPDDPQARGQSAARDRASRQRMGAKPPDGSQRGLENLPPDRGPEL